MRELHSHVHDGAVAGSVSCPSLSLVARKFAHSTNPERPQVIRNITNRYGEAYAEANSDIKASLFFTIAFLRSPLVQYR